MKKSIIAISILFGSSAVMAMPMIKATPSSNGAWVQITDGGAPVAEAIVNQNYTTDANGRVFVYDMRDNSSSVNFSAVTPQGDILETYAFLQNRNNRNR